MVSDFVNLWDRAYSPAVLEHVRAVSLGDGTEEGGAPAVVLSVDRQRQRALMQVSRRNVGEAGRGRVWDWFSMIRPAAGGEAEVGTEDFGAFLLARCRTGAGLWVGSGELWESYRAWCEMRGRSPLSWTRIRLVLRAAGVVHAFRWMGPAGERRKLRGWAGMELR